MTPAEPDYIVIRDPENEAVNGRWIDKGNPMSQTCAPSGSAEVVAYTATPFIEVREDGAVAQVYMRSKP